jgi:hypothetical protein
MRKTNVAMKASRSLTHGSINHAHRLHNRLFNHGPHSSGSFSFSTAQTARCGKYLRKYHRLRRQKFLSSSHMARTKNTLANKIAMLCINRVGQRLIPSVKLSGSFGLFGLKKSVPKTKAMANIINVLADRSKDNVPD